MLRCSHGGPSLHSSMRCPLFTQCATWRAPKQAETEPPTRARLLVPRTWEWAKVGPVQVGIGLSKWECLMKQRKHGFRDSGCA